MDGPVHGPGRPVGGALDAPGARSPGWVERHLGALLVTTAEHSDAEPYSSSVSLALRDNPRRAHLLVSSILGKHIPVPSVASLTAGRLLGRLVREAGNDPPVVVGFAETATGLGHAVASTAGAGGRPAPYLHTTRRAAPQGTTVLEFAEEHSHATEQRLAVDLATVAGPALGAGGPLVLVDDEVSTGRTAVNAIRSLHSRWPRDDYVLAALLDIRTPASTRACIDAVADLGARLAVVSLLSGSLTLPPDFTARTAQIAAVRAAPAARPAPPTKAVATWWEWGLPAGVPLTGAGGWGPDQEAGLAAATCTVAAVLAAAALDEGRLLVLGDEEFLYPGQLLAAALGGDTSSTTRSPALTLDEPGYPLRSVLRFAATAEDDHTGYAYNVAAVGGRPGYDRILLLLDRPPTIAIAADLAAQVAATTLDLHVVTVVADGSDQFRPAPAPC